MVFLDQDVLVGNQAYRISDGRAFLATPKTDPIFPYKYALAFMESTRRKMQNTQFSKNPLALEMNNGYGAAVYQK